MIKFAAGALRFQTAEFEKRRALFKGLAEGQAPEALFITCSDSRIDPNLITQSEPGELFICRNAGNIVPPHSNHTGATTAAIELAVGALGVPHIIICGHSGCGAMKGAMHPETLDAFPHVREWLAYTRAAALITDEAGAALSEAEKLKMLTRHNVLLQIAHLKTHPYVAAALAANRTQVHGWVYDLETGAVVVYDEARQDFIPLADHYKDTAPATDASKK